jgi:predicted Holliday junction resolvase-like endonuclease
MQLTEIVNYKKEEYIYHNPYIFWIIALIAIIFILITILLLVYRRLINLGDKISNQNEDISLMKMKLTNLEDQISVFLEQEVLNEETAYNNEKQKIKYMLQQKQNAKDWALSNFKDNERERVLNHITGNSIKKKNN